MDKSKIRSGENVGQAAGEYAMSGKTSEGDTDECDAARQLEKRTFEEVPQMGAALVPELV